MSIVRVGLSENQKFAEGYEAIFGKKTGEEPKPEPAKAETPKPEPKEEKKPAAKGKKK